MNWWKNEIWRVPNSPLLFLGTLVSPHMLPPSFSPVFLGEAGNNSIFNYSIQRTGKVNSHWRTALEQREQESWRHIGHMQKTAFVMGQGGLLKLHIKGEKTHIFRNMKGVDQRRYIWPDRMTLPCHLDWNTTGEFFYCRPFVAKCICTPNLAYTTFFLCQTYIENFPVTVLICRWSLGGKGETVKTKAGWGSLPFSISIRNLQRHCSTVDMIQHLFIPKKWNKNVIITLRRH